MEEADNKTFDISICLKQIIFMSEVFFLYFLLICSTFLIPNSHYHIKEERPISTLEGKNDATIIANIGGLSQFNSFLSLSIHYPNSQKKTPIVTGPVRIMYFKNNKIIKKIESEFIVPYSKLLTKPEYNTLLQSHFIDFDALKFEAKLVKYLFPNQTIELIWDTSTTFFTSFKIVISILYAFLSIYPYVFRLSVVSAHFRLEQIIADFFSLAVFLYDLCSFIPKFLFPSTFTLYFSSFIHSFFTAFAVFFIPSMLFAFIHKTSFYPFFCGCGALFFYLLMSHNHLFITERFLGHKLNNISNILIAFCLFWTVCSIGLFIWVFQKCQGKMTILYFFCLIFPLFCVYLSSELLVFYFHKFEETCFWFCLIIGSLNSMALLTHFIFWPIESRPFLSTFVI